VITNKLSSYHLVINVLSSDYYVGKAVVTNNQLFQYVSEKEGFSKEAYKQYIIPIMVKNVSVKLDSTDFKKFDFEKVCSVESVQNLSKEGTVSFLKYYFTDIDDERMLSICTKNMSHSEQIAVISVLFNWKIPSFVDDETGHLMILRRK
jgi:fucose permease